MSLEPDVVDRVRRRLLAQGPHPTPAAVAEAMRADGVLLGPEALLDQAHRVHGALSGAGPLEPLLRDPAVTDVLVTGPDEVWVDRGAGAVRVADVRFADDDAVRRLAQRLAAAAGRRLDDAQPWVDARLTDGTRVHAVLHPVAVAGTCLSLRVPRRRGFTLDDLVGLGALPERVRPWLEAVVAARLAFLLTGGTGTGKTSWLGALLAEVDPGERIVLVEDSAELAPVHPHVVRLEARPPNVEGAGAVTLRDLVRQSLRMRPDRVVVGEVRGAEVVDLLAALNTGHEGGAATVHANSRRRSRRGSRRWAWPRAWTERPCTRSSPPASTSWFISTGTGPEPAGGPRCRSRGGPTGGRRWCRPCRAPAAPCAGDPD
jgi:pilus assembly protein CpaF